MKRLNSYQGLPYTWSISLAGKSHNPQSSGSSWKPIWAGHLAPHSLSHAHRRAAILPGHNDNSPDCTYFCFAPFGSSKPPCHLASRWDKPWASTALFTGVFCNWRSVPPRSASIILFSSTPRLSVTLWAQWAALSCGAVLCCADFSSTHALSPLDAPSPGGVTTIKGPDFAFWEPLVWWPHLVASSGSLAIDPYTPTEDMVTKVIDAARSLEGHGARIKSATRLITAVNVKQNIAVFSYFWLLLEGELPKAEILLSHVLGQMCRLHMGYVTQAPLRSKVAASRGRRPANYEPQSSCQSPKLIVIWFLSSVALIWERKITSIWIKLEYFAENGQLLQRSSRFFWVQEYKTWRHILLRRKASVNAGCYSDPVGFASVVSRVVSLPGRTYLLGSPFLMKYFVGIKLLLMEIITNIYSKEEL